MNSQLEERLQGHLGRGANRPATNEGLIAVKKRARRRSMQTRIAAGALGLAALAGLGSLVPTGDTTDSLITATEPTPESGETEDTTPAATTTPPATPDSDALEPQPAPAGFSVVSDGRGGFVAPKFLGSFELLRFVRSTDGETWFNAEQSRIPEGFAATRLRFEDGYFVVELDGAGNRNYPNQSPHLAISEDLVSWEIIDLGLEATNSGPQTIAYSIGEVAVNGDQIAVSVFELHDVNYSHFDLVERDLCALVVEPGASTTFGLCDGELVTSQVDIQPTVRQHVFVRGLGDPATELVSFEPGPAAPWNWRSQPDILLHNADSFSVASYRDDPSPFVRDQTATELAELGDPQLLAAHSVGDQTLFVVETTAGLRTVLRSVSSGGVEEVIAQLPPEFGSSSPRENYHLDYGPAGWAITANRFGAEMIEVERNGWHFEGDRNWPAANISAVDGSEQIFFDVPSISTPPSMQLGLFGGVRYFHPVSGELLVELSRQESATSAINALDLDQAIFDRTMEVDGWTIGGHPLHGPLIVTSPTGVVTEYADGFAFDNDDITDGVETDIGPIVFGDFALQRAATITFYDADGAEVLSVRGRDVFRELVAPVIAISDPTGELLDAVETDFAPETVVAFSVDGSDWDVIWSPAVDQGPVPALVVSAAVGDDEILIALPNDIIRVPIDTDGN